MIRSALVSSSLNISAESKVWAWSYMQEACKKWWGGLKCTVTIYKCIVHFMYNVGGGGGGGGRGSTCPFCSLPPILARGAISHSYKTNNRAMHCLVLRPLVSVPGPRTSSPIHPLVRVCHSSIAARKKAADMFCVSINPFHLILVQNMAEYSSYTWPVLCCECRTKNMSLHLVRCPNIIILVVCTIDAVNSGISTCEVHTVRKTIPMFKSHCESTLITAPWTITGKVPQFS